jgi:hypothetical protein
VTLRRFRRDIGNELISLELMVAEYAVNNKIASEPAFAWWVPHVLRKRASVLSRRFTSQEILEMNSKVWN